MSSGCRVKVKICGIRRPQDIEYVNRHLPDYTGFVFAQSKRQVSVEQAHSLVRMLDSRIQRVGIFVNVEIDHLLEAAVICGLDVIQLHGGESGEYIDALKKKLHEIQSYGKIKIWKAIPMKDERSVMGMEGFKADAFVLDAYAGGSSGGTGRSFDWRLAEEAKKYGRIILAGGLNIQNIHKAVSMVQPFAVDTSSGVETDGFKDEDKIKRFIYSVRYNVY